MRWVAAFITFIGVLTVMVFVFGFLGLEGPWNALGTVIAISAAVVVFRAMRKAPAREGEGL